MTSPPYIVTGVPVSLYRRKPGGHLHYRFTANGTRHRESTGVFNDRDARAIVRPIVLAALDNKPASPFAVMTMTELLTAYLAERWPESERKGNQSYGSAKSSLNIFAESISPATRFAGMTFDEARVCIQTFIDTRKVFLSGRENAGNFARTLNSDRLRISRLCSWLMKRQKTGAWIANPAGAARIEIPPSITADPEPLDDTECDMVTTAGRDIELWPVIVLCLGVGTRPAEAIRVQWSDVDFERHLVAVTNRKSKRARPRYPVMSKWAQSELSAWKESHPDTPGVWTFNKYVSYDQMGRLREDLGLPGHVTLQGLRQTACTRAILGGMKLADYVMQFGHSLAVARNHYLKFGKLELAERRQQIEKSMFKII